MSASQPQRHLPVHAEAIRAEAVSLGATVIVTWSKDAPGYRLSFVWPPQPGTFK